MVAKRQKDTRLAAAFYNSPFRFLTGVHKYRGLHANLSAVHQNLETAQLAMLFLAEIHIRYPATTYFHSFLYLPVQVTRSSILWLHVDFGSISRIYIRLQA